MIYSLTLIYYSQNLSNQNILFDFLGTLVTESVTQGTICLQGKARYLNCLDYTILIQVLISQSKHIVNSLA